METTIANLLERVETIEALFSSKLILGEEDPDRSKVPISKQVKTLLEQKQKILSRYSYLKEYYTSCM